MPQRVRRKWRPPLWFVLAGPLAAVFALPLIGIGYFRIAGGVLGWAETAWMIFWMALLATAILGYLLWRLVILPVRELTDHARAVVRGEDGAALRHHGTPEFTDLGQSVLDMGRVLKGREQVVRSYADHVTHEMKSPLTVIAGASELLASDGLSDADRARLLQNVDGAVARMRSLLDDQRAFARASDPLEPGETRLSDALPSDPDVTLARDGTVALPAPVMEIVLSNLVGNARSAGATEITVTAAEDGFTLSDNGPGISEGNRARIFDPFFTTKRESGGTGMGLAITRRMLEAQGAEITLEPGPGARFRIRA